MMNRMLIRLALAIALACGFSSVSGAQVSMTGDWYSLAGPTVKLPVLGPNTACSPGGVGACVNIRTNFGTSAAIPANGGVPGAAANVAAGKNVGDPVLLDPSVFSLPPASRFTPVPAAFAVQQLNTQINFVGPAPTVNVVLPAAYQLPAAPAGTRKMSANNWLEPGNGQAGRVAAITTPIQFGQAFTTLGAGPAPGTQVTAVPMNIKYTAGQNAFGGTMALMLKGNGQLYIAGAVLGGATLVGIVDLVTPFANNFRARPFGAGWGLGWTGSQPAGDINAGAVYATACTNVLPPLPLGCDLVLNIGFPIAPGALVQANSSLVAFAWTTGLVSGIQTGTEGGNPVTNTLSAQGKDTVTPGGNRNISLVSAGFARRVAPPTALGWVTNFGVVEMQLVPEPATTAALFGGIVLLGAMARRTRRD